MNKLFKLSSGVMLILLVTVIIFLSACTSTKNGSSGTSEWIKWTVAFKPGASQEDISAALGKIDAYILNYIYKEDPEHRKIVIANISHKLTFGMANTGTIVIITTEAVATGGAKVRITPPRPPKNDLMPNLGGIDFIK